MPRVLVTWLNFDSADPATGGLLETAGLEVVLAPKTGNRSIEEVRRLVQPCVAAIVSTDPFDQSVFDDATELRVIARIGVGVDSVDVEAATRAGVVVTTTRGANQETTADHTVALLLAVVRRVLENDRSVRGGEWSRAGGLTGGELTGSTVGLVGYGTIGRAVARRLEGFGVDLLVSDPYADEMVKNPVGTETAVAVTPVSLDDLLIRSDIVTVHAPLDESTRGMIGERELAAIGPDGILINTARGGLVDEAALVSALKEGQLKAAGLDVFEEEPLGDSPLTSLSQVVLTPHIGGLSDQSIKRMLEQAARQVVDLLAGNESKSGVVNPEALVHPKFAHPVIHGSGR